MNQLMSKFSINGSVKIVGGTVHHRNVTIFRNLVCLKLLMKTSDQSFALLSDITALVS